MSSVALLFAVFLAQGGPAEASPAGPERTAEPPRSGKDSSAHPRDTIASLLGGDRGPEPPGARAEGMDFRLLGWVAVVAILGLCAARIGRRVRVRGGAGLEGGGLRVVSRAALTPRHSVFAVRVGTQRLLVVGVSRERIVPLLEIDDPTRWMALDPACGTALGQDEPSCGRKENGHGEGNGGGFPPGSTARRGTISGTHLWRAALRKARAWAATLAVAFCLSAPSLAGQEPPLPENGVSPAHEVGQGTPPAGSPEPRAQPDPPSPAQPGEGRDPEPEPKAQSGPEPPAPRGERAPSIGPEKPPVSPLIGEDLLRTLTGGDPAQVSVPLKILGLLTVLSLVPSIVLLTTCFPRIVIVLSFLRRAIGTQDLPPNQVMVGLALFLTILVMAPVWREIKRSALEPYRSREIGEEEALHRALLPLKRFMVERTLRSDLRLMVGLSAHGGSAPPVETGAPPNAPLPVGSGPLTDLPITVVAPAFILSELKTAFQMGFVLYLPFVLIDLIVSTALISMGMLMLPPVLISLPFKVLIFVLVDGWRLVVQEMVRSLA